MVRVKNPFTSLDARGTIGKVVSFTKRRKQNIAEKKPEPFDAQTALQLSWRHMFLKVVALWNALSAAEKETWESLARPYHMTGYAWFISQSLKPNPGIYLPLQGGTMSGNIDMDYHKIEHLPWPLHAEEPVPLALYNSWIAPYLYHQGAHVYHNVNQNIPNTTWTALDFNDEVYDSDFMHSVTASISRVNCKTAGKYLAIAHLWFEGNATGFRVAKIRLNNTLDLVKAETHALPISSASLSLATIYPLAVDDYLEVWVYHNRGVAFPVLFEAQITPDFMVQRIGE